MDVRTNISRKLYLIFNKWSIDSVGGYFVRKNVAKFFAENVKISIPLPLTWSRMASYIFLMIQN
jgi:hypothetical protein